MVLDNKTKKILKVFCLVFLVAILTGCAQNLDANGKLIASRAITSSTPWSFDAGWFDFIFVIPLAKGILFINDYVGNVAFGVIDQINRLNAKNAIITTRDGKDST